MWDLGLLEDQHLQVLHLILNELKKLDREVLTDNWEENMSLYKHKRKKD